jgi:hypothetical protein
MQISTVARISRITLIAASALALPALPAHAATIAGGSDMSHCTRSSHIRLAVADHSRERLRVRVTISGDQSGGDVAYVIEDNGNDVTQGVKQTKQHGMTTVRRFIPDLVGTDTVIFVSTNHTTGEMCAAQVKHR